MMTLFEFDGKTILYTGDYTTSSTALTEGCVLPEKDIDIMIICAVHARHSNKPTSEGSLKAIKDSVLCILNSGISVFCHAPQLSKGVELLKIFNETLPANTNIYIDDALLSIIKQFEQVGIPMIKRGNYTQAYALHDNSPHIIISSSYPDKIKVGSRYRIINANFSLHDGFNETAAFIKRVNPKLAVVVHSPYISEWDKTVEQELARDAECRTNFIFAENGQAYLL